MSMPAVPPRRKCEDEALEEERRTPRKEKRREGIPSCRFRAQREGESGRSEEVELVGDFGVSSFEVGR